MKKLFTLLFLSVLAAAAYAQSSYYVFCDKDGHEYDNDATITCDQAEVDAFGGVQMPSGLYVKNVDAPDGYKVAAQANITSMDNGSVQLCFPVNCLSYTSKGTQKETDKTSLSQGATQNMQTEWLPAAYGDCKVVYSLITYQTIIKKATRTITVNYHYGDPTGVSTVNGTGTKAVQTLCDLQGRSLTAGGKGLSLVRMADGSIRKVVTR